MIAAELRAFLFPSGPMAPATGAPPPTPEKKKQAGTAPAPWRRTCAADLFNISCPDLNSGQANHAGVREPPGPVQ